MKQIHINMAIIYPFILYKEEPYPFNHNWTYFHTQYSHIYVQNEYYLFIHLLYNLKLYIKETYQKEQLTNSL